MRGTPLTRAAGAAGATVLPAGLHVLERGWLSSNNVLFEEGDHMTVIDTGYASQARLTAALIDRAGGGRRLARIVNTHLHSDHVGGNARLARQGGVSIYIPAGSADAVRAWDVERLSYAATGQRCPRFAFSGVLRSGDVVLLGGRPWQVLAGAGHDPQMLMLHEPDRGILISADALWQRGFGAIFPEVEGESGFFEQRTSLDLIGRLRPRVVIPGHGAPFSAVSAALEHAYRRLDALQANPERNARHVLKLLVKFWLLQVGRATRARLIEHFGRARYARRVHQRYFRDQSFDQMLELAARQLCEAGAAVQEGPWLKNIDDNGPD